MGSLLIINAEIAGPKGKPYMGWLLVDGLFISDTGKGEPSQHCNAETVIDFEGDLLMPGMIDTHVHFREPGLERKATIESESSAAVAGGVTSFFDMPNTVPPTVTLEAWEEKTRIASETSMANYAFYIGATNSNLDEVLLKADYSKVPGVKLFLGSSTGNLLVDSGDMLERLFAQVKVPVAVHAEDNRRINANAAIAREVFGQGNVPVELHPWVRDSRACLDSTLYALNLAGKYGAKLHLLHLSTAAEAKLLELSKYPNVTSETCVHYLYFSDADYDRLGTRIKCNPAIKSTADRSALRKAIKNGVIDVIGSDHAPHLLAEKEGDALTAPSGMPGMQHQLPLLLDLFGAQTTARLTAANPARIFDIDRRGSLAPGYYADMVRVARRPGTITDGSSLSKCKWTPYSDATVGHSVVSTWVNGRLAYDNGTVMSSGRNAMPLAFNRQHTFTNA